MTREERELALYCLKASSDYHSEVCEECINYPNCDHMIQDDVNETIIEALEQEPNKEAYNQGYEDGYLAGQKNIAERFEGLIKSGISTDTPDDIKYVIGLLNELSSANPEDPETEIEELDFVQEHKKIPVTLQVQKYCDRNICVSNEYNGIGCNECEVTKSQEPQESEGDE